MDDDLFEYDITATPTAGGQSFTTSKRYVGKTVVPDSQVQVLAVAGPDLVSIVWPLTISPIYDYAKERGFKAKKLYPATATWSRVKSILQNGVCRMLFVTCHGYFQARPDSYGDTVWRTHMTLKGTVGITGRVLSYPVAGYHPPRDAAVSELGFQDSNRMRLVMIDACKSGESGSVSGGENDMAQAFGMYSDSNMADMDETVRRLAARHLRSPVPGGQ